MTLIPLKLYLNEKGKVKLLIGIAKGNTDPGSEWSQSFAQSTTHASVP